MAKRPLSVQLRPSSALHEGGGAGSCLSARRLSMGDVVTGEQRASSSQLTGGGGPDAGSGGRRPADLGIIAGSSCLPRRRDRCSPSTCKRPIVLTLPRLDLSLIQGAYSIRHTFNSRANSASYPQRDGKRVPAKLR